MDILGASLAQGGRASSYGAIAYSPTTGRYGWSCRAPERATAEKIAINSCGTADATIVVWGGDTHLALALGDGQAYGSAWDANRSRAEQKALETCSRYGTNCRVALQIDTRRKLEQPGQRRRGRQIRAVVLAVIAAAFAGGAIYDLVSGGTSPWPSLVLAIVIGVVALTQARLR
jgi:serine/threonine-protein kinase